MASEMIAVAAVTITLMWRTTGALDWSSVALVGDLYASSFLLGIPLNERMHRSLSEPRRPMNQVARVGTAVLAFSLVLVAIGYITGSDWVTISSLPFSLVGGAAMLFGFFTSRPHTDLGNRSTDSR